MKLVNFDQSKLLPEERFYANGFELIELGGRGHAATAKVVNLLRSMWLDEPLREGFRWENTANNVTHLRPCVAEYSEAFMDLLFANNVPQAIQTFVGKDLHLCHIQVVRQTPGLPHQGWHRDAYQYGGSPLVGAFPPTVKFNFYPRFEEPQPRLEFVKGSHRCMVNDASFDAMLVNKYDHEQLLSSNDHGILFETSMLHAVVPDSEPKGSVRLMYSFVMEHEYQKRFASKNHHATVYNEYERRKQEGDAACRQ